MKYATTPDTESITRCDECFNHFTDVLEVEAFGEEKNEHLDFCSWSCLFKHLPKITGAYHVTLPGLDFDETKPGLTVGDFWRVVGEVKKDNDASK